MIYFVEDDASIRELVLYTLNNAGLQAEGFERPSAFWAAMEHRVSYKKQYDNKEQRVAELLQYSNILEKMEKEFEKYNDHPVEM